MVAKDKPAALQQLPITTRSRVVLEIAAEMVAMDDQPLRQAKVLLRRQGSDAPGWPLQLFGSSTDEGIDSVVRRESALAIINPSGALTLAYRGVDPYTAPQPVRVIGVIPSHDQLVFAVHPKTGLSSFEQIRDERSPLRLSIRGQKDHCIHQLLEHVARAAGFSLQDIPAWGGQVMLEDSLPFPDSAKFKRLVAGELDAVFDEGAPEWLAQALEAGLTILPLAETTLRNLEQQGYRRSALQRSLYPRLAHDIPTLDFSGWPIFVHADLDDLTVTRICQALEARRHLIPWEGEGPLPTNMMCRDTPSTPLDVPLHPAAKLFWAEAGYI